VGTILIMNVSVLSSARWLRLMAVQFSSFAPGVAAPLLSSRPGGPSVAAATRSETLVSLLKFMLICFDLFMILTCAS
jgi:hypothetical protein